MKKGVLVIVSGFSGAGKGTMVKRLRELHDNYSLSISMTTRNPRPGEENGKHYFFVTKEEFEDRISQDGLIEYATYCDNYYGTPRAYVEECIADGKDVILEIEIQGAMQVKERFPDAIFVFVTPPNAKVLEDRLIGRGTEEKEVVIKRLRRAVEEAEGIENYGYIVVNDELDDAVARLHNIVEAAHLRTENSIDIIQKISEDLSKL